MNKENQIEEMAKAIYNLDHCEGYKDDRGCMYAPSCSVCKYGRENKAKQISELLAKQGYRKASEIFEEIEEGIKAAVSALQFENNPIHRQVKHETYSSLMRFIKTVEQKYTESEKDTE